MTPVHHHGMPLDRFDIQGSAKLHRALLEDIIANYDVRLLHVLLQLCHILITLLLTDVNHLLLVKIILQ